MAKEDQTWLDNYLNNLTLDKDNVTEIFGRKITTGSSTPGNVYEELTGELKLDNYPELKTLDLTEVNELDKLTISNCPKLEEIKVTNSGVKKIELGSGLNSLLLLDFGFETSAGRSVPRKVDELDLSNVPNLKILKCFGVHTTRLLGTESLTQLQKFDGGDDIDDPEVVVFPINEFHKWKKDFDTITATDPNHLDLLKGGTGPDKDDINLDELKKYKERFAEYVRIHAKLGGKVNDSDLDNFLRAELERVRLEKDLTEANSKLVKSQKDKDNARYLNIALGFISAGLFLFLVWLFREKKDFSKLEDEEKIEAK